MTARAALDGLAARPWLGVVVVLLVLGGLLAGLKVLQRWARPPAELLRKLMHVGAGLTVLTFPWVFRARWPVLLLSAGATALLLASKRVPRLRDGMATVVNGVRRPSLGEVYFPVSVGALFVLSGGDRILYCVPMLIMTLADTVAALIGLVYGRVRYVTSEGLKSAEGSIAFFSIAFLSVHVPLLLCTAVGRAQTLLVATIIGLLSMLLEAIAWRGLDNLLIPLGAFGFLQLYLHKTEHELVLRLLATIALLVFALAWRRRSSLDDSALMAGALFAYGAAMLGGPAWLVGPIALFLAHVCVWPRVGPRRRHTVWAVASVVGAGLLWLSLHAAAAPPRGRDGGRFFYAYAISFGVHLAVIGTSYIPTGRAAGYAVARLAASVAAGSTLVGLQLLAAWAVAGGRPTFAGFALASLATAACVGAGAAGFFSIRGRLYAGPDPDPVIHAAGFAFALLGSGLAAVAGVAWGGGR